MLGPDHDAGPLGPHGDPIQRRKTPERSYTTDDPRNYSPYRPPRSNAGSNPPSRDGRRPSLSPSTGAPNRTWSQDGDRGQSQERNRSRNRNGRAPSGGQRTCKKCGEPLTGQFVRALDGTFHLDCFRCRVSSNNELRPTDCRTDRPSPFTRIADKSWHPSSSQLRTKTVMASIPFAKQTTSGGSACYAINVVELCEGRTSQPSSENTTSTISPARSARPSLVLKTATTNMMDRSTAIIITLPNSLKSATDVRRQFLSSLLRFSEMDRISIGIPSAT